jgi:N-acetyl sugar amidotransferase
MKYCKICLQNDLRPNIIFTKDQICPACNYKLKSKSINWNERFELLKDIIHKKTKNNNSKFDCIIGVSGGKDSTRQALWIREKLNLKPLLVCFSYPPEQVSEIGVKNISNLIELGFDIIISSGAPQTWRSLVKEGFKKFTNWAKSTELALFSSVPQIAVRFDIPLIFWGENPAEQLGDLKTKSRNGWDGNKIKNMNTLAGGDLSWISNKIRKKNNLFIYNYPSLKDFKRKKIQIIYLGWFWKNWTLRENAYYSIANGLQIRDKKFKNFGDLYRVSALDEDWVTINQMIKYYKYGFGKASEYVNEDIRNNVITRSQGIKIIKKYDNNYSEQILNKFCQYIEISKKTFWTHVKKNTNKGIFKIEGNQVVPKFKVGTDFA